MPVWPKASKKAKFGLKAQAYSAVALTMSWQKVTSVSNVD